MRTALFSEREREIIKRFLKDGTKLDHFTILKSRAWRSFKRIHEDYLLLKEFLKKLKLLGEREQ